MTKLVKEKKFLSDCINSGYVSSVGKYVKLFEMDDITLEFKKDALNHIVDKAIDYNLGARGLRSLCEEILNDAMFNLPGSEVKKLVITKKYAKEQLSRLSFEKLKAAS